MKSFFLKSLILTIMVFTAGSCTIIPPVSKNLYIKGFAAFVNDVELNYDRYDQDKWEKADRTFEKFAVKYFSRFKNKMDQDEIRQVNLLKGKYIGFKVKGKSKNMLKNILAPFKDIIEQSEGVIDSFIPELDTLQ